MSEEEVRLRSRGEGDRASEGRKGCRAEPAGVVGMKAASFAVLPEAKNYEVKKTTESRDLFVLAEELCSEVVTVP